ncbi:hypothetical protein [Georgenia muralis]|uniref:Uncharacterized protein n=1 Tax=Georgenia muralis TaxID=154117 RepID=A0A3N5A6J3_9MICO|nr:hypothetical protein [Georgenia muralis]RPF29015.1 hypothetical protein EDD32_3567 [Georgenia muralis]
MRRTIAAVLVMTAAVLGLTTAAHALTGTLGNPATDRAYVDGYHNFTIVDTNHPAPFDGTFTHVNYYAERAGDIRFVVVDTTGTVTWVSDVITAAGAGVQTATLADPVGVTAGSNIGVFSVGQGVVSYEYAGAPSEWTANNAGLPAVGDTLDYEATTQGRVYSMNATVEASSPEVCKDGGWEMYDYKNQGQCIASIVADSNSGK